MRSKLNLVPALSLALLALMAGCRRSTPEAVQPDREAVTLQTDWFAQAEHGGFYQALAKGFYAEAGLDVSILQGGPNAMSLQKVLTGKAQFGMNKADMIVELAAKDLPLQLVFAHFQHDPQALMLHADDPAQSFADLDGRTVMANPGHTWIKVVEARYGIDLKIIPNSYSVDRFLADPTFVQQCILTNEPFFAQQHGATVKTFSTSTETYDPYHVVYAHTAWVLTHPETVARFVEATRRGWQDYLENDPEPAFRMILERNPQMTPELLAFGRKMLIERQIVTGSQGAPIGEIDPARLEQVATHLRSLGIIPEATGTPGFDPVLVPSVAPKR